ncbi:aminoglycoside phosphotransferase family protein [Paenibacillus ginsengarvi]|uniref:Aminoglycoside phosphotransferase family protein n=1 Tax=Paenibacillus ginsengarvi TaxID=400777 RepID=A0A3B0CML3_9BACL|nr:aminoglycoside phosphotransferase family protein [Paenibacillus ginsengarvi]RKN86111.1 aminoglycoside phosphotransferase family protein [Paenibacillus ginsengarvi]
MKERFDHIRNKVEVLLNSRVDEISKMENVPNNSVYKVIVNNKSYIFKIYKQRTWPEDGKLVFIHKKLMESHIDCARIIAFDRTDPCFHTGFLLEECLPGVTADQVAFDDKSGKEFYKKLALLVSKIHRIRIENFGYIGSGIAGYESFIEFMEDKYDEIANALINKKVFDENCLVQLKKPAIAGLRLCENLPSVLCHGDLSTKNVIIGEEGSLTLIDWDDAMSYNWIADISRLTYWMKFKISQKEYELYRNTFLEHYSTEGSINVFHALELTFHVWIGLDFLNFYANTPRFENTLAYFKETVEQLT